MNYSLENLKVWQNSRELTKEIYQLTSSFPQNEKFGLTSQLRKAIKSVSSNVTEGSTRWSKEDQSKFYQIAFNSLIVVLNQLVLATYLKVLKENQLTSLRAKIDRTGRMLKALSTQTHSPYQV